MACIEFGSDSIVERITDRTVISKYPLWLSHSAISRLEKRKQEREKDTKTREDKNQEREKRTLVGQAGTEGEDSKKKQEQENSMEEVGMEEDSSTEPIVLILYKRTLLSRTFLWFQRKNVK